ncbi:MAG: S8 family serine peptidase [Trueperaceae bacterium]
MHDRLRALRIARPLLGMAIVLLVLTACGGTSDLPEPTAGFVVPDRDTIRFPGTRTQAVTVDADGTWTATSSESWLTLPRRSGTGTESLTLNVDRTGLTPDDYAATVTLRGDGVQSTVRVAMRFPRLTGRVDYPSTTGVAPLATEAFDLAALRPNEDYLDGDLLVRLDPIEVALLGRGDGALRLASAPLSRSEISALASNVALDHGMNLRETFAAGDPVVRLTTDRAMPEAIAAMRADPRVQSADPNYLLEFAFTPNDPLFPDQWHYDLIGLPSAWNETIGHDGVTIAVIDGGFQMDHEDLEPQWADGDYDFANGVASADAGVTHCAGHGTHVAGTVGAATDNNGGGAGVAPGARMLPLRIGALDADDQCQIQLAALVRSMQYVAGYDVPGAGKLDRVPDVVNLSLGGPSPLTVLESLLEEIAANGTVTVAASGNVDEEGVLFPARYATTIAVGAVGPDGFRADYSTYGPELDVVAPGGAGDAGACNPDDVVSTVRTPASCAGLGEGYGTSAGTSMAAPHVAGVVALLTSLHPDLGLEEARTVLQQTADGGGDRVSDQVGYGMILADDAVRYAEDARYEVTTVDLVAAGGAAETRTVTSVGTFAFDGVAAGDYDLRAFEGATLVAERAVTVAYDGDRDVLLDAAD